MNNTAPAQGEQPPQPETRHHDLLASTHTNGHGHHTGHGIPVALTAAPPLTPTATGRSDPTREFLAALVGDLPPEHFYYLWELKDKKSAWFPGGEIDAAVEHVRTLGIDDIYVGVAAGGQSYDPNVRLCIKDGRLPTALYGLYGDIDFSHPCHKKTADLPPTLEAALELVDALPLRPSLIVHSGHGLQPWWLFKEPWLLEDDHDRRIAAQLSAGWSSLLKRTAHNRGWAVDSVHDLTRVLRLPGTTNCKIGPEKFDYSQPGVPVTIYRTDPVRYPVGDFDDFAVEVEAAPSTRLTVGKLVFDEAAEAPAEKLDALLVNCDQFALSWERKRRDMKDPSPSGYGMSLANYAAKALWTDQEICNLIIHDRRRHGDKCKHPGAVRLTIEKAIVNRPVTFTLGNLTLIPETPRRTESGKLTLGVKVLRDGKTIAAISLSSSDHGVKSSVKRLADLASLPTSDPAVRCVVDALLAWAADQMDAPPPDEPPTGNTVGDIVREFVPTLWTLEYRTEKGAYDHKLRKVARADFLARVPQSLVDLAQTATDAPLNKNGTSNIVALMRLIKLHLEIVWTGLMETLPLLAQADHLACDSVTATQFIETVESIWHKPKTFVTSFDSNRTEVKHAASLASRTRHLAASWLNIPKGNTPCVPVRQAWVEVHPAYPAWYRPRLNPDTNKVELWLAMTAGLAKSMGVPLPELETGEDFRTLGERFGIFDPTPPVKPRTSGGRDRLIVLAQEFAERILDTPVMWADDENETTEDRETAATCGPA